jgi:hypothetical protein
VNETELQEILSATLVSLKTQMIYVRNLNDSFAALFDSAARVYPELDSIHKEEMRKIRPNPVQQEHIRAIDELLDRLGTLRRDTGLGPRLPGM